MEQEKRILAVEDDPAIVALLREIAARISCQLDSCADGKEGLHQALMGAHDLLVLDLQLTSLDGFEICKQVRIKLPRIPILILTSRIEETDKVLGLELGADDYVTKPFGSRELEARLKALLRRANLGTDTADTPGADSIMRLGELVIDVFNRRVLLGETEVSLTATEFALLILFASHPGRTFTRGEILERIWGYKVSGYEPTLSSHLSRLRHKLEQDPVNPKYITTVHGVGYRFEGELTDKDETKV